MQPNSEWQQKINNEDILRRWSRASWGRHVYWMIDSMAFEQLLSTSDEAGSPQEACLGNRHRDTRNHVFRWRWNSVHISMFQAAVRDGWLIQGKKCSHARGRPWRWQASARRLPPWSWACVCAVDVAAACAARSDTVYSPRGRVTSPRQQLLGRCQYCGHTVTATNLIRRMCLLRNLNCLSSTLAADELRKVKKKKDTKHETADEGEQMPERPNSMGFWLRACALNYTGNQQHHKSTDKTRSCLLHNIPENCQHISGHKAWNDVSLSLIFPITSDIGNTSIHQYINTSILWWQPQRPGRETSDEREGGTLSIMCPSTFAKYWEIAQKSDPLFHEVI